MQRKTSNRKGYTTGQPQQGQSAAPAQESGIGSLPEAAHNPAPAQESGIGGLPEAAHPKQGQSTVPIREEKEEGGLLQGNSAAPIQKDNRRGKPALRKRRAGWNRRFTAAACLLAAVLAVVLMASLQARMGEKQERYEATFFGNFDTVTVITGYAKSQEEFEAQAKKLEEKLRQYHELFDIYHTYEGFNNLKSINDAAGKEPVKVNQEIINMLKLGISMYQKTAGKVNIAYGSVLSLWHSYREEGMAEPGLAKLPPEQLIKERMGHTDISKLIIDEEASTVFLEDKEMSLDVGSIGKGYAVQRLAAYAKEQGMDHLLLSVGGNVCAVGGKLDGSPWRVGIENPGLDSGKHYVGTVGLSGKSIVTSGDYQRYYVVDGKRYCHIIDPDTGMPPEHFPSVSVLAEDSGLADALSTALFNMELEEGLEFVESLPEAEALWILEDGGTRCTSGFKWNEEK